MRYKPLTFLWLVIFLIALSMPGIFTICDNSICVSFSTVYSEQVKKKTNDAVKSVLNNKDRKFSDLTIVAIIVMGGWLGIALLLLRIERRLKKDENEMEQ